MLAWIKRHQFAAYFILTFLISWGGVLILGALWYADDQRAIPEGLADRFIPYFLGPAIAGLLMTGLVSGGQDFGRCSPPGTVAGGRSLVRGGAAAGTAAGGAHSPAAIPGLEGFSAHRSHDGGQGRLIIQGVMVGLIFGGFLEELGWTGFAVPRYRRAHSIMSTGLLVGLLHGFVACAAHVLGHGRRVRSDLPAGLHPAAVLLRGGAAGVPHTDGVGLRPHRPACCSRC